MTRHDVIVIGGSLAGSACVRELTRLGIDAVAFERDRFPRRKVCGGFLSPGAVECLDRLGLLTDVQDAGAVQVRSARVRVDSREYLLPFERPGLGISRITLDTILAEGTRVEQGRPVHRVSRVETGFMVDGTASSVIIDAAGKLSRFTPRRAADEFGIQYTEKTARGSVLDFWFFEDGYGGAVSVEGDRSNFSFLIKKDALGRYLRRGEVLVTGPVAYHKQPGEFIAIGDAAGMVDPFCGEGMRHALDSGMLAAAIVARGIRSRSGYEQMKYEYEREWERRWKTRRRLGAGIRRLVAHRGWFGAALRVMPSGLLNRLWS